MAPADNLAPTDSWASADSQQHSLLPWPCSLSVPDPILLLPACAKQQQQQRGAAAPWPAGEMEVCLVADVKAPMCLMGAVLGWQTAADSPEELRDRRQGLCLMAAWQGRFCPLRVGRVSGAHVQVWRCFSCTPTPPCCMRGLFCTSAAHPFHGCLAYSVRCAQSPQSCQVPRAPLR